MTTITEFTTDPFAPDDLTAALTAAEGLALAADYAPRHSGYLLECTRAFDPDSWGEGIGHLDLADARPEATRGGDLFGGFADPVVKVRVTVLLDWHGYDCVCDGCLIENGRYLCGNAACGYDMPEIDGDKCPECGHHRKSRSDD